MYLNVSYYIVNNGWTVAWQVWTDIGQTWMRSGCVELQCKVCINSLTKAVIKTTIIDESSWDTFTKWRFSMFKHLL